MTTPQLQRVPVESLTTDPHNVRRHSRQNLKAIAQSLQRFGQQKPIVIDAHNRVIAGNGTLAAAISLGWKDILVTQSHLTANEATAFAIADNRTAELASWDNDALAQQLASLQIDASEPHTATGFTDKQIEKIIDRATGLASEIDTAPQPVVFQLLITCADESDQKSLYHHLTSEGYTCRVLTL